MKKTIGALIVLGTTLPAQAVAPAAYATKEGERHSYYVGGYQNGRFQFAEGGLRGKIVVIGRIGYRRDVQRNTAPNYCGGRTWSNVKLHFSDCEVSKMTNVWTKNNLTVPKKLFDSKYSWPSYTTATTTTPAPFDQQLSFPLTSTYVSKATKDVLIDFQFSGGTLANNATWGTTSLRSYYKDAPDVPNIPPFNQGTVTYYGNRSCKDTASAYGGLMTADFKSYAQSVGDAQKDNKFFFEIGSYFTAPDAPVIQALSLAPNTAGLNLGTCNNLHLQSLLATFAGKSSGTTSLKLTTFGYFPYDAKAVGFNLYTQTAWDDSKSKVIKLTQAAGVQIPSQPPTVIPRVLLYHHNSPAATTGTGPHNYYYMNAVVQYSAK